MLGGAGTENWIFLRSLGSMALAGSHRSPGVSGTGTERSSVAPGARYGEE